jgi:hypothetical protein
LKWVIKWSKVKYRKTDETGGQKITTEPYLVDAPSHTEAESRINEEMAAYMKNLKSPY